MKKLLEGYSTIEIRHKDENCFNEKLVACSDFFMYEKTKGIDLYNRKSIFDNIDNIMEAISLYYDKQFDITYEYLGDQCETPCLHLHYKALGNNRSIFEFKEGLEFDGYFELDDIVFLSNESSVSIRFTIKNGKYYTLHHAIRIKY